VSYNAESQATALKVGYNTGANEIKEFYTYNPQNGLLTNQKVQKNPGSPTNLLNLSYDYAKVGGGTGVTGQLTKITNGNPDPTKNRFYEYDALARLKTAKGGETGTDWQQNYSYDRYGNRLSVTKTGIAPLDAVNPGGTATAFNLTFASSSNRITTSNYEYDFAGNLTRGQDPDGVWQRYEYDAANRLKVVKNDAGTTTLAEYLYGASNQRLKTVDNSVTNTWYVWEGGKVIAEYNDASGAVSWAKSYVYLGERLLATESTTIALQFHHPDRLGTRLVANASDGTSAGEQETLPFGTALGAGISGNQRRFTSYDRSTTTKLDYAVNRAYNAVQRYAEKRGKVGSRERTFVITARLHCHARLSAIACSPSPRLSSSAPAPNVRDTNCRAFPQTCDLQS
jgi:YD repeat-containing protein